MKKLYTLLALISFGFSFGQVNYLVEHFNYAAAAPLTSNGWTAHSGTTNPILVSSAGLNFTGYVGSGVGNAALVNNTGEDLNKPFGADISSGSVYASFLVSVTATTPLVYFFHLGYYSNTTTPVYSALNSAFRARTYIAPGTNTATQFKLGLAFNGTATQGETSNLTIGQTYLVVVKYKFITGDFNDEVSLFVYSTGDAIPTAEPATPTLGPFTNTPSGTPAAPTADAPVLQAVILRQADATQRITVDGIVVRTVWDLVNAGTALSTNNFELSQIRLYPNPALNVLNVNINPDLINQPYSIIDGLGRVVLNGKLNEVENNINVEQLSKGIYYLKLSNNKSIKFIKK
jgi:hypothetical protein